ncbi:MAG: DinB family protein [Saprospiraceae bacterium]|nr:DinB family protein [Saprospiraceae bacterium]
MNKSKAKHMKLKSIFILALGLGITGATGKAAAQKPMTLKQVLIEQLKTTHADKDWFVPANLAVAGLTAEQANWDDGQGNHSIGQLATHLIFWNERMLEQFEGKKLPAFEGDNQETFTQFNQTGWETTVQRLDEVLSKWEYAVQAANDEKINQWASTIAHIGTHNAYHIGQIIYIRKDRGWWDAENGVK